MHVWVAQSNLDIKQYSSLYEMKISQSNLYIDIKFVEMVYYATTQFYTLKVSFHRATALSNTKHYLKKEILAEESLGNSSRMSINAI